MPSLKIDIVVDDQGRPIIDKTTASMRELAAATKQADAAMQTKTSTANNHQTSMAGLTSSILRLYAAYYLLSSGIRGVIGFLGQGIQAIDDYNLSIAKMAAMMTGMMVPDKNKGLAEQYREAHSYAKELNVMIEKVDKETLLTAKDLRQITEEMMKQGVVVDVNNKKQVEGFTAISNALAVIAAGAPNKEIQLRQEIRSLLQGELRDSNQLAKMLEAQTGNLKEQIALHKEQGDIIEWLGQQLRGFTAAQDDINASWEASKTTLQTIYEQILRAGFQTAFTDINEAARTLAEWATQHKAQIGDILEKGYAYIKIAFYDIKNLALDVWEIMKGYEPLLRTVGGLILKGVDAFGYMYAALGPIATITGTILAGWLEIVTAVARFNPAAIVARLAVGESFESIWKDAKDTAGRGQGYAEKLKNTKMADIPGQIQQSIQAREDYKRRTMDSTLGDQYSMEGWGGTNRPKLRPYSGDGKDKGKTADVLSQIVNETKQWQDKIEELDPYLTKEDNQILKLTNDAENLIKRIEEQGKKGGVSVAEYVTRIREGLEQGIGFITDANWMKGQEEYEEMMSKEAEYGMTENQRAANAIIAQEEAKMNKLKDLWWANKITDEQYEEASVRVHNNAIAAKLDKDTEYAAKVAAINYNLIKGIAGMQEWAHELRMKQIDAEVEKLLKDGADPRAVEAFRADAAMRADIDRDIKGSGFADGYQAQLEQYKLDMKSAGQYGAEMFVAGHDAIKSSFKSLFTDIRNGQLKSFEEYFTDFTNKISDKWMDMLSEMLANWITTGQAMKGAQGENSGGTGFLGAIGGIIGAFLGGGSPGLDTSANVLAENSFMNYNESLAWGYAPHKSGVIGSDAIPVRLVSRSAFDGAPRYHSGIGPDERAAIIRADEGVFTPGQMKALSPSSPNVNVNIINNNGSQVTQSSTADGNGGVNLEVMIDGAVAKQLSTYGSQSNKAMRNNYGSQQTLISR